MIKFNGKDIIPRFNGKDVSRVMFNGRQIYPTNIMQLIDLGLPSGNLWSNINLGAKKVTDAGYYVQFGDINGYTAEQVGKEKTFSNNTYKYSIDGSNENFSKYNNDDGISQLENVDDIAYNLLGVNYHTPSNTDFQELVSNTTKTSEIVDGIKLIKLISNINNNYIYIPLGGLAGGTSISDNNSFYIMSSNRYISYIFANYCFYGNDNELMLDNFPRASGFNVRPIYKSN